MKIYFQLLLGFIFLSSLLNAEETRSGKSPEKVTIQKKEKVEEEKTSEQTSNIETLEEFVYPSNFGTAGIFRLRSGNSLPQGTLTFGIGAEFFWTTDAPNFGTGGNAKTAAENLFVGYAPLPNFTIALQRRNSSTTYGSPEQLISSLGDLNLSLQYQIITSSLFKLSPIGNFQIASNFNNLAPAGNTVSAGLGVAGSFHLSAISPVPLILHTNLFYHMPQIRGPAPITVSQESFFNFSRFDTIFYGVGAELRLGSLIPFVEYTSTIQAGSNVAFFQSPSKISVGSRLQPLENKSLSILLGADIGLGRGLDIGVPFSPPYQVIAQLSYTVGVTQTERKHYQTSSSVGIVDRKFVLDRNINFKTGSNELDEQSKELLNEIAEVIQKNNIGKLLIVGHTDSSNGEDYNLKLSQDRAQAVKKYLMGRGISDESLMTQGFGKRKPKASNQTEEGRKQNRRVEFLIVD